MITIDVLNHGFLMTADDRRFAYSCLDDLLIGLGELIEPQKIGIDRPDGTSSTTWTTRDGSSETFEDDGWREWDGHLVVGRGYPPGILPSTIVQILTRGSMVVPEGPLPADDLRWHWSDGVNCDPKGDIIRYRVVRP